MVLPLRRGAIGADGHDADIQVDLPDGMQNYVLPAPPQGEERKRAILASIDINRLAQSGRPMSGAVAALVRAVAWRAVLGPARYSVQITGPTGAFKSCALGLAMAHHGRFDHTSLPRQWRATEAAIVAALFAAKDSLVAVDDWVIDGSSRDRDVMQSKGAAVFRAQGNGKGRDRCNPDGTPRPSVDPRGSLISSGESRTSSASAEFRTLAVWVEPTTARAKGTIDSEALSLCQADAEAGLYRASTAAFVRWLAPQLVEIGDELSGRAATYRDRVAKPGDHGRTPDIVADMAAGASVFLDFAVDAGALTRAEADAEGEAILAGLLEAADEMRADQGSLPTEGRRFVEAIGSALSSGAAYLADQESGLDIPSETLAAVCGWRREERQVGKGETKTHWYQATGASAVGWVSSDGGVIYLDPTTAFQAAQRMIREQGGTFSSKAQLGRMLNADGLLAKTGSWGGRERLQDRVTIAGQRKAVYVLRVEDVLSASAEESEPASACQTEA